MLTGLCLGYLIIHSKYNIFASFLISPDIEFISRIFDSDLTNYLGCYNIKNHTSFVLEEVTVAELIDIRE